ncbi:MAG: peptide deformylase [Chthoniobacterales bacterium]
MPLQLTYYGHPALRSKGKRIEKITPEIRKLVPQMLATMHHHQGCGLAAQQIGRSLQLAVIDVMPAIEKRPSKAWKDGIPIDVESIMPLLLINPEITPLGKKTIVDTEGCLSIPDVYLELRRPARVKIRTQLLDGEILEFEAEGLLARAAMHETDHLHGILFIDHAKPQELEEYQPLLKKMLRQNMITG